MHHKHDRFFHLAIRYTLVSGLAYLFHLMSVWFANKALSGSIALGAATAASFLIVATGSYFGHRNFTFKSNAGHFQSTIKFILIVSTGAFFSGLTSFFVKENLPHFFIIPIQIVFIIIWGVISGYLMKSLVFKKA